VLILKKRKLRPRVKKFGEKEEGGKPLLKKEGNQRTRTDVFFSFDEGKKGVREPF